MNHNTIAIISLVLLLSIFMPLSGNDDKLELIWANQAHNDEITSIDFSSDGKYIVSTANSKDSFIKIWDTYKGTLIKAWKEPNSWHVNFSPDGKMIAAGGYNGIVVRNSSNGTVEKNINVAQSYSIRSLIFSPDGKSLICSGMDKKIRTFNPVTGEPVKEFIFNHGFGWETSLSHDNRILAGGGNKDITLWNFETGETLYTIKPYLEKDKYSPNADTFCLSFTPDNACLFTAGADGTVRKWDVKTGSLLKSYKIADGWIFAMDISPDGERVAVGSGWNIYIININTDSINRYSKTHNSFIKTLAYSPDGKYIATGSNDRVLKLWKLP